MFFGFPSMLRRLRPARRSFVGRKTQAARGQRGRRRGIISDKICSKTNKNNQGQVTNLSEQVIAMGPGNEFTPKFKMDAHEDTKINIYEDEDMNIHNNTAAV